MKKIIDWQLFSAEESIVLLKDASCDYEENKIISLENDEEKNIIDIENKMYIRVTKDSNFVIDFNNKTILFKLDDKEFLFDLPYAEFKHTGKRFELLYKLDDEIKKIVVIMKG